MEFRIKLSCLAPLTFEVKKELKGDTVLTSIDDVKYWLAANNPVLIAVYHPERDSLYAVHVQGYAQAHAEIAQTGVLTGNKRC